MAKTFRIVDFETTGLNPYNAGIIEVGWTDLVWEGTAITITDPQSQLCNPGIPIELGAMAVHHIRQHEIEGMPHPSEVLPKLDGANFYVAHNAKFERGFWKAPVPWICTMRVAQQLYPQAESFKNQFLRYMFDLQLEERYAKSAHRAGDDSYVTAHLLLHMIKFCLKNPQAVGGNFIEAMLRWSNEAQLLKTVSFGKHKGEKWSEVPRNYLVWVIGNTQDDDVRKTAQHYLNQAGSNFQ